MVSRRPSLRAPEVPWCHSLMRIVRVHYPGKWASTNIEGYLYSASIVQGFKVSCYDTTTSVCTLSCASFAHHITLSQICDRDCNDLQRLFDYISGENEPTVKVNMTAPVVTKVEHGDGPFCKSNFTVSFFVPFADQVCI